MTAPDPLPWLDQLDALRAAATLIYIGTEDFDSLTAVVRAVLALHRPWHWDNDRKAVVGAVAPDDSDSATFCTCAQFFPLLYSECPTVAVVATAIGGEQ